MELILYGAGNTGRKFYYGFKDRDEIVFVIDNYKKEFVDGIKVYTLDDAHVDKQLILVAAERETYLVIKELLKKRGYKEFMNFIPAELYNKRLVLIHGNCYVDAYKEFLLKSQKFNEKYYLYEIPQIHLNEQGYLDECLLASCDLFIHQDIRHNNPYSTRLADDYVLPKLKEGCQVITVPNLVGYGKWCFPNIIREPMCKTEKEWMDMYYTNTYLDKAIVQLGETIPTLHMIKTNMMENKDVSREDIIELFDSQLEIIKEREKQWDIKVSDYIKNHYKTEKLFTDLFHISYKFMCYICVRLGKILQLEDVDKIVLDKVYDETEEFVPQIVVESLGLEWKQQTIRNSKNAYKINSKPVDIDEYIKQYVYWNYSMLISE